MKPQKQPIEINFSGGLDTKTDKKQVQQGKFLVLENSVFDTAGQLTKRNGHTQQGSQILGPPLITFSYPAYSSSMARGVLAATYNDELVLADGYNLYSYSRATSKPVYKGRAALNELSVVPIHQDQYTSILADSAINNTSGYTLYAWESWSRTPDLNGTYRGIGLSLFDTASGQQILTSGLADTTSRPKCVAIGSLTYIVYYDSTATSLKALEISTAGPGSTTVLANNINTTTPNYDLVVNGSTLYVAYNGTASTVKVSSFNSSMASIASASKSEIASNGIGVFYDTSNNVWVSYNNSTETKAFIMDSALAVTVLAPTIVDSASTATNVKNVTGVYNGTLGIIFYDQPGLPALSQSDGNTTNASFTQPAVGSTVTVITTNDAISMLGTIIFIVGGGYYYVSGYIDPTQIIVKNLGYVGNAAPAASVSSAAMYPTTGNINATTNYNTLTSAGVVGTAATLMRSCALNSRAFLSSGLASVMLSYDSQIQPTYFLASLYNISSSLAAETVRIANVSAKIFPGDAGGIPYKSILPNVSLDSNSIFNIALPKRIYSLNITEGNSVNVVYYNGIQSVGINYFPSKVSSKELGKTLIIGSGNTLIYDGNTVSEEGFNLYPENITGVQSGSGFLTATSTYGYQVVYQWIDANGQIYRSAPSAPLSIELTGSNQTITLTVPTLRVTARGDVTITFYRTAADGSIYYRVDTQRITPGFYPINNSLTTDTITIVDGIPDSNIIGNEQLYTTGGEVENIAPAGTSAVTDFKSRAIVVPFEDSEGFGYSKQVINGVPVEFSDLFFQNISSVGGNLVTAAPMDDKLILYKSDSIYYMVGSGPAPSGANNDFTEPLLITTDCGCVDKTSVVRMPLGHMFKSKKGIYLLDRGMQAQYIGSDVEEFNQYDVLSAVLIENNNQVRFALSSGDVLMYDYYYKQWSVFTNLDPVSACVWDDAYTYIKSDGTIWKETPGLYLDGATPVLMSFMTSWIKLSGLQGYQRAFFFYILGEYLSAHSLTLDIAYDYSETSSQTTTIVPDNSTANTLERWRIFLARQRCQAVQISLQENHTTSNGAGFTMSGVQFVVGLKSGFRPTPTSHTAG